MVVSHLQWLSLIFSNCLSSLVVVSHLQWLSLIFISHSLSGEQDFIEKAKILNRFGGAVVVMAFDEAGQAADRDRKGGGEERLPLIRHIYYNCT